MPYSDSTMNSFDVLTPTLYWFILLYNSNSIILNVYLKTIIKFNHRILHPYCTTQTRWHIYKIRLKGQSCFQLSLIVCCCLFKTTFSRNPKKAGLTSGNIVISFTLSGSYIGLCDKKISLTTTNCNVEADYRSMEPRVETFSFPEPPGPLICRWLGTGPCAQPPAPNTAALGTRLEWEKKKSALQVGLLIVTNTCKASPNAHGNTC